ncbi:MAG: adenosylcobinamide-GDP ribazoletransferase [Nitrospiraceae bacterium]|nr:adenosylcobinamide-GDP ribazoletransferase [Nitrospiraceae bacterium]
MIRQFLLALQFLTIIPVNIRGDVDERTMAQSSSFFCVVGIIQGILLVAFDLLFSIIFSTHLVSALIVLLLVLTNGGFHLDGLADTFDALAVKEVKDKDADRQKRLSVMRDSSAGPIGVISIVFAILIKYLSLNSLANFVPFTYYSTLFLMPVISKWAMTVSIYTGRSARENGLGNIFINRITKKEIMISTVIIFILFALILFFFKSSFPANQYMFFVFLIAIIYLICRAATVVFNKKFGGLTGDTLGAISEITEIIFLLAVIAWSRLFIW